MLKRAVFILTAMLVLSVSLAQAGIVWQIDIKGEGKGETNSIAKVWAQGGLVREEFVEVTGKVQNKMQSKGMWWLYKTGTNTVYIVDPEEKTWMGVQFDSLMNLMGAIGNLISMKITNIKSEIKDIGTEKIGDYDCKHIAIVSSYDMEMKVLMMKVKSHTEKNKEIWSTSQVPMDEIALSFREQSFKTGMAGLDSLVQIEMQSQKDLGFILKSVETSVTTDAKGKESDKSTSTMTVTGVEVKDLSADIFEIPKEYKEINLENLPGGN
jgi:Domain of unknown function (DUF4412)